MNTDWMFIDAGHILVGAFTMGTAFPLNLILLFVSFSVCFCPLLFVPPSFFFFHPSWILLFPIFSFQLTHAHLMLADNILQKEHSKLDLMCFVWAVVAIFFWNWMGLTLFVYLVTSAQRRQPALHFPYGDLHAKLYSNLYHSSWYEDGQNVRFVFL